MAVLDTSFLIDLLRGKKEVEGLLDSLEHEELVIAAPSIEELWCGALLSAVSEREKKKIHSLCEGLMLGVLDDKSARLAGEIEASLIKKGVQIQVEDCMIAGIAKARNEKIVTRDEHYARIDGVQVLKY